MASLSLKKTKRTKNSNKQAPSGVEIKAVYAHNNFFPSHYLEEALTIDVKGLNLNGKKVESLRDKFEKSFDDLSEEGSSKEERVPSELRKELSYELFHALGFAALESHKNEIFSFKNENKNFEISVDYIFDLKSAEDEQLWVLQSDINFSNSEGKTLLSPEHFILENAPVSQKLKKSEDDKDSEKQYEGMEEISFSWQKLVNNIFEGDYSKAEWLLICSGTGLYLFEKEKWQKEEAFLELNLVEMFSLKDKNLYRLCESLFSAKPFAIEDATSFHAKLAENAHKKATEVTKSLRDSVRESIESIANEALEWHRENSSEKKVEDISAAELYSQSLRYVYKLLFVLFTESQHQAKGSLPVHSKAYQMSLSVEKLRKLEGVSLLGKNAHSKNFIQHSLARLFSVYFSGFHQEGVKKTVDAQTGEVEHETSEFSFSFPALGTDLFDPKNTNFLDSSLLSDHLLQKVIRSFSLASTGTGKKKRTYRVHYAGLGINQLGAVYESLLSLKPSILKEDCLELVKEKKEPAPRYVPASKTKKIADSKFAKDERGNKILRKAGSFAVAPVGLERKFSASFYTPQVLTDFLVKEAVDSLLGEKPNLEKMESLKILEPAMGSGAFLNAAIDYIAPKMAKHYRELAKKTDHTQKEEDRLLRDYEKKAKNHLMRHCVYGVDLNHTAVELAKVSLWLNSLHEDGHLPFLDNKLRCGNSLIGAWFTKHKKDDLFHFLIPHKNSFDGFLKGSILKDKKRPFVDQEEKNFLQEKLESYKNLAKDLESKKRLLKVQDKIQNLYNEHLELRKSYQKEINETLLSSEKKKISEKFIAKNTAYNRLRLLADLWCTFWFWPKIEINKVPDATHFLDAIEWIVEKELSYGYTQEKELQASKFKFLVTARKVSLQERFFHYDLEYAEVMNDGGFDLVLGNPPWAPVRWEEKDFFEEVSPGIHDEKGDSKVLNTRYTKILEDSPNLELSYVDSAAKVAGTVNFLKTSETYLFNDKSQVNTYRYFYQRFYDLTKPGSIHAMIAQDGILTDKGCVEMRPTFYKELEKLFRFVNEKKLFEDVAHLTKFGVWVCLKAKESVSFDQISNLYIPETVESSRKENVQSRYSGKQNEEGGFEVRGHPLRIVKVDEETLKSLAKFSAESDFLKTSLPIIHGEVEKGVLLKLAAHEKKLNDLEWYYWRQFDESGAPKKGLITRKPGKAKSISHAVMTGPNIFVATPANKNPNPDCKHHLDFSEINLEEVSEDFYPDTVYECTKEGLKSREYNALTPWGEKHSSLYRVFYRGMVSTTGARTLSSALLPPGPSHINAVSSLSFQSSFDLLSVQGLFNSLIFDFLMRNISGGTIGQAILKQAPVLTELQKSSPLLPALCVRTLRLSAISTYYNDLWAAEFKPSWKELEFESNYKSKLSYRKLKNTWSYDTCVRNKAQREQALCEVDALVAHLFNFSKEDLVNLYRSQFGALQKRFQDLPNQEVKVDKFHFPRAQAMSEAYDQVEAYLKSQKKGTVKKTEAA